MPPSWTLGTISRCSVGHYRTPKLISQASLLLEAAQDTSGDGSGSWLLHAAHRHAQMMRLHDDHNTLWIECFYDGICDLSCQTLSNLQPASEHVGDAGEFRKTNDLA